MSDHAGIIFLLRDVVDDVLLRLLLPVGYRGGGSLRSGANEVSLIILPSGVSNVNVYDVVGVVDAKHGVGLLPVDEMNTLFARGRYKEKQGHVAREDKFMSYSVHGEK